MSSLIRRPSDNPHISMPPKQKGDVCADLRGKMKEAAS
jgi:hypothetical protein